MTEYRDGYLYELDPPPGDVPGIPPRVPNTLAVLRIGAYASIVMLVVIVLTVEWWYR